MNDNPYASPRYIGPPTHDWWLLKRIFKAVGVMMLILVICDYVIWCRFQYPSRNKWEELIQFVTNHAAP